jgi:GNAT superfamily N-acetyltransferase
MTQSSPKQRTKCELIPINLDNEHEFEELRQQRIICGWNSEHRILEGWRNAMTRKIKSMFWITIHSTDDLKSTASQVQKAGHISLDSASEPPDLELANPDKSVLTIATFFIYPAYRGGGLGRTAMGLVESYATKEPYGSPNCKTIAINTLDKRYWEDDGWRTMWKRLGRKDAPTRGSSKEAWYERMGYVKWKSEPRYQQRTEAGEPEMMIASFLRKKLQ